MIAQQKFQTTHLPLGAAVRFTYELNDACEQFNSALRAHALFYDTLNSDELEAQILEEQATLLIGKRQAMLETMRKMAATN